MIYLNKEKYEDLVNRNDECGRMLKSLEKSLNAWKSNFDT